MSILNKNAKYNTLSHFSNTNNVDDSLLVISFYLLKHCKLWVWDFDDTLIDTKYYYKSDMDPEAIRRRTDTQLTNEVPQWQYFKRLITYLVQNGKYVAIASFGTYEIIKAYMDRIMGFNQTFFTNRNLIAPTSNERKCRGFQVPPNKNEFIYKIMKHYKIEDFNRVVLFDDLASNIADAIGIGIVAIQIDTPSNSGSGWGKHGNGGSGGGGSYSNVFFGPWVMKSFDKKIENDCGKEVYLNRTFAGITNTDTGEEGEGVDSEGDGEVDGRVGVGKTNIKCTRKIHCDNTKTNNYYSKYNHQRFNASCFKNMAYDKTDFNNDGVQEVFNPVVFGTSIGNRKISTNSEYRWNKMNVSKPPKFINGNWETYDNCDNDKDKDKDNDNDNGTDNWADSTLGGQSSSFWEKNQIFNKKNDTNDTSSSGKNTTSATKGIVSDPINISEGFENVGNGEGKFSDSDSSNSSYDSYDNDGGFRENDKLIIHNNKNKNNNNDSGICNSFEWNWIVLVLIVIILMMVVIIYNL